jgi:hypothetical protein
MKTAIVVYRKNVYRVSPTALQAMMELTRGSVDSQQAMDFVLRQEGYDLGPLEAVSDFPEAGSALP